MINRNKEQQQQNEEIPSVVANPLPGQSAAPAKMAYKPVEELDEEYES